MTIFIGYVALSLSIGFLVGASNSPVVGAFITAFFGLVGTIIGAQYLFERKHSETKGLNHIGAGLILVSLGLVSGALIGEGYRNDWGSSPKKILPWANSEPPSITAEALDWIATSEKLQALGYSYKDINAIYQIRVTEREMLEKTLDMEASSGVDEYSRTTIYESGTPFNSLLSIQETGKKSSRGPASVQ